MARRVLRKRERLGIAVAAVVVLFLALTPMMRNLSREYERSEKQLAQAQERLRLVQNLRTLVEEERVGVDAIQKRILARDPQFDLYSFTDQCLRDLDLKGRAELQSKGGSYSGRKQDGVQLLIKGVSTEEFVNLLHSVYAGNNLIVVQRLLYLRPARDGMGLDCQVTFVTPRK